MAQGEHTGPLMHKPVAGKPVHYNSATYRTTALGLPFFDDFTDYDLFPNHTRWVENQVYINNTMCVAPISRGVATFDALNEKGLPWDPYNNLNFRYSDSLTSQPINLSTYSPGDSLYLSFFYQPQGNGFYPLPADSFILFMRVKYGGWLPVWKSRGSTVKPFRQAMIPITDSLYFYDSFQFRFVNIAALNYSDAIWNLDYVRLDANRTFSDTLVNDIAMTAEPSYLLNDYTSMPYRHFFAAPAAERAASYTDSIRNNTLASQPITHYFSARDVGTGTVLQAPAATTTTIPAQSFQHLPHTAYTTTVPMGGIYDKVVHENKYYLESTTATGPVANDTIVSPQVFDNYLAYDDGTAEQSYYLTLFPTLPGKIVIEHHLNVPDTMRGMAIYFGRQVPSGIFKLFSLTVYTSLAGINGATADNLVHMQDLYVPGYEDTINHYWIYKFDTPVPLSAGTFYAGCTMPAESGSDSLYFGLDMNRRGGNHAYYNVLSAWNPSLVRGAIMMRPLMGKDIKASDVPAVTIDKRKQWHLWPNPATNDVSVSFPGDGHKAVYSITNTLGQVVLTGNITSGGTINISTLQAGMYIVNIGANGLYAAPKQLIKL